MREVKFNAAAVVFVAALLAVGPACRQHVNRVMVATYRTDLADPERFYQDFTEAWFASSGSGEYEILLRSSEPLRSSATSSRPEILSQSLYCRIIWRPIPGRTFAEPSQINARVDYRLELAEPARSQVRSQGPTKLMYYKGSGFVSFKLDRAGKIMRGTIEQVVLDLHATSSGSGDDRTSGEVMRMILEDGKFQARLDPGRIADYRISRRKM